MPPETNRTKKLKMTAISSVTQTNLARSSGDWAGIPLFDSQMMPHPLSPIFQCLRHQFSTAFGAAVGVDADVVAAVHAPAGAVALAAMLTPQAADLAQHARYSDYNADEQDNEDNEAKHARALITRSALQSSPAAARRCALMPSCAHHRNASPDSTSRTIRLSAQHYCAARCAVGD